MAKGLCLCIHENSQHSKFLKLNAKFPFSQRDKFPGLLKLSGLGVGYWLACTIQMSLQRVRGRVSVGMYNSDALTTINLKPLIGHYYRATLPCSL